MDPTESPTWIPAVVPAGPLVFSTAYIVLCPCSETMGSQTNGAETLVPARFEQLNRVCIRYPWNRTLQIPRKTKHLVIQGPSRDPPGTLQVPPGTPRDPLGLPGGLQGPSRDSRGTSRDRPGTLRDHQEASRDPPGILQVLKRLSQR